MMNTPLNALVVEDNPFDAELLLRELARAGFDVTWTRVDDAVGFRAALAESPDIVLCDFELPQFGGLEALRIFRERGRDIPFLLVSGMIGEESAVEAMKEGATDYLLKDRLARLGPAIRHALDQRKQRAQQRQTEEALRLVNEQRIADARFRALLEAAPDAMVIVGTDGKIALVNRQTERLFGYERKELVGRGVEMLIPESLRERHSHHLSAYFAQSETRAMGQQLELRARRKDGSEVPIEVSLSPLQSEGELLVSASIRDVTARKEAEAALQRAHDELEIRVASRTAELRRSLEELRASEARFAGLAASGLIGVAIADVTGGLREMNDAYLAMLGFTRDDLTNGAIRWMSLTPPEWQHADALALKQLEAHGVAQPFEKELIRKDGSRVPVLLGVAMAEYPKCLVFAIDLSAQKAAQRALRDAEGQLRQAQKMEAIGTLAGGVAHDFNNLLSVILSYGSLLEESLAPDDPLRDDAAQIVNAGERGAALTRQLLTFSRQQVFEPKVLDLNDVLENMDKMLRRIVGEDIEMTTLLAKPLGRVSVDPGHIEQVVMNLAVNARDAMPNGGRLVMETCDVLVDHALVRKIHGLEHGPHVRLTVKDTGVGMDKGTQARIFEPFFTTKQFGKGTGLGLSTVFGIVQQSGGAIWVESEPDHGTTFDVYLPYAEAKPETARVTVTPSTLRGTETILLVEDEERLRAAAREILKRRGYTILEARSGSEALELCELHEGAIHLLLSDVVMPQMSGPDLASRVMSARPKIRVLCMSGYTDDRIVRHGVVDAKLAFLQKPFTPQTLARKVREVLDG